MAHESDFTPEEQRRLFDAAVNARQNAYARYSNFKVGAALLDGRGRIYSGCNVENSSYGLTICAERVAVFCALGDASSSFRALAVATPGGHAPCGACRQVLAEFCDDLPVFLYDVEEPSAVRLVHLAELLPRTFRLKQ
jgi:cytidine deaminase